MISAATTRRSSEIDAARKIYAVVSGSFTRYEPQKLHGRNRKLALLLNCIDELEIPFRTVDNACHSLDYSESSLHRERGRSIMVYVDKGCRDRYYANFTDNCSPSFYVTVSRHCLTNFTLPMSRETRPVLLNVLLGEQVELRLTSDVSLYLGFR